MSLRLREYWFFAILFAGSFIAAMAFGYAPASASLCGTSITTGWSTSTDLDGDGSTADNGDSSTSDGTFTAECDGSDKSVFSGTYLDQPLTSEALDTFYYEVFATGDETLQVDISASDGSGNGPNTAFPNFTLALTDIDWGDLDGSITDVTFTSDVTGFGVENILASSFDITFDAITFNCNSDSAGRTGSGDGCTYDFSAVFTIVAEHDVIDPAPTDIPEPASAGLFLVGLTGFGVVMRRRKKAA